MPELQKSLKRIASSSIWLANELGIEEESMLRDIELASNLFYIGKLYLSDRLFTEPVMKRGIVSGSTMETVPYNAKKFLNDLRGLEKASILLYHVYENFDGSGFPEKLQGWKIPIGSRIIRVTGDFEDNMRLNNNMKDKSFEMLEHEIKRLYDFKIVALFDQYFAVSQNNPRLKEKSIHRKDLEEGMIISRNIYTESGMKIIAAGTNLDNEIIEKIRTITKEDPYIGKIYIMPNGF
jgi:response regulator RpfG family c-di-GMP phosphodiesterase